MASSVPEIYVSKNWPCVIRETYGDNNAIDPCIPNIGIRYKRLESLTPRPL